MIYFVLKEREGDPPKEALGRGTISLKEGRKVSEKFFGVECVRERCASPP